MKQPQSNSGVSTIQMKKPDYVTIVTIPSQVTPTKPVTIADKEGRVVLGP